MNDYVPEPYDRMAMLHLAAEEYAKIKRHPAMLQNLVAAAQYAHDGCGDPGGAEEILVVLLKALRENA